MKISWLQITISFVLILQLIGCGQTDVPNIQPSENSPGGTTTVSIKPFANFSKPVANLPVALKPNFYAGQALARQPWIKAPTITIMRDGLGPLYNSRTCLSCHIKGGKGTIPDKNNIPLMSTLVRVSKPGQSSHPIYGDQIQGQSTSLAHQLRHSQKEGVLKHDVAPEAFMYVSWGTSHFIYPDKSQIELREPTLELKKLGYGPLGDDTQYSIRLAPAIQGMGLIELIPQADINALADEYDQDSNGISGRINRVWDIETQKIVDGRFGLKANKPTLKMTIAGAFANDIGITNSLFPAQPCTNSQIGCRKAITGNDSEGVELPDQLLELVVNFNRNLAPVQRRNSNTPTVIQGRTLFYQVGCQQCHQPSFTTGESIQNAHLSEQIIWPYSDFLLHDMGLGLADGRPDFLATGSEWRTPPLWGVGLQKQVNGNGGLLHDGRARTIEEAILWHGGEAVLVKNSFIHLSTAERNQLIEFVRSL
jgi:CxxC motif-containing protein (DUF1111 family)